MVKAELKKIALYTVVLAVLLVPMLGLPTAEFNGKRPLYTMLIMVGLLFVNMFVKVLRSGKKAESDDKTFTEKMMETVSSWPKFLTLGGVLLVAILFPLLANDYQIDIGIMCLIYVALGLGLNIVVGLCGLLDLGYIAFFAVGAYTYSLLNLNFGINFWFCLPVGVVFGMTAGCIIGYPTLKMRGDYLAIVTLGFGEIVRLVLNNWDNLTAGPNGLFGMAYPPIPYPGPTEDGGLGILIYHIESLPAMYYLILAIAIFTIIGVNRLNNSRIGRAWIAIREDEVAAELTGVPTTLIKLLAYALGAAFASVAGAFFAAKLSYTNPNFFLFMESCIVLCIVVLGGVGSIPGIIVAAIVLIAVPQVFQELENYRMLAFGGIMTTMMVLKPEGLLPAPRRKRELHEAEKMATEEE